jgi:hypothetical protein
MTANLTGKLTGDFLDFSKKTAISAQIPQFCFLEQGITGNSQLFESSRLNAG